MKIQSIALKWAWYIWRDAVTSWKTNYPSTVKTWADACREGWLLAKEECSELRDNTVKTARKILGVVREFVISASMIADKTVNPSTTGSNTTFTIECNRSDVYNGNGQRRQKRSSYLRPAMNAAIANQLRKEYKP